MKQIKNIHRIDVHTDEYSVAIPCTSGEMEIAIKKLEHFSARGGLRTGNQVITQSSGTALFTPEFTEDGQLKTCKVKAVVGLHSLSISELLAEIVRRQAGGEIEEPEVLLMPVSLMDQMEAAARAGDRELYKKLKNQMQKEKLMKQTAMPTFVQSASAPPTEISKLEKMIKSLERFGRMNGF